MSLETNNGPPGIADDFWNHLLAEMGDKTQLAAMTMAAQKNQPWAVFIGSSLALVCVSAIGVLVGTVLSQYLPLEWIKRTSAVAFIIIGVLILLGKF